jgi:hypothetical protein
LDHKNGFLGVFQQDSVAFVPFDQPLTLPDTRPS